jgi:hypothetical protein
MPVCADIATSADRNSSFEQQRQEHALSTASAVIYPRKKSVHVPWAPENPQVPASIPGLSTLVLQLPVRVEPTPGNCGWLDSRHFLSFSRLLISEHTGLYQSEVHSGQVQSVVAGVGSTKAIYLQCLTAAIFTPVLRIQAAGCARPERGVFGAGYPDEQRSSERRALGPLNQIAARQGCVFLLVRHLNKANNGLARYRGSGSIGFQGACRSTWLLERDPVEPGRLVLAQVKNNLASLQQSLAFTMAQSAPAEVEGLAGTLLWHCPSPWSRRPAPGRIARPWSPRQLDGTGLSVSGKTARRRSPEHRGNLESGQIGRFFRPDAASGQGLVVHRV